MTVKVYLGQANPGTGLIVFQVMPTDNVTIKVEVNQYGVINDLSEYPGLPLYFKLQIKTTLTTGSSHNLYRLRTPILSSNKLCVIPGWA